MRNSEFVTTESQTRLLDKKVVLSHTHDRAGGRKQAAADLDIHNIVGEGCIVFADFLDWCRVVLTLVLRVYEV